MNIVLDIAIILFAVLAGLCWLCGRPVPGGVNSNVLFYFLALFFCGLAIVAALWRFI